jgi:hypothetical protein
MACDRKLLRKYFHHGFQTTNTWSERARINQNLQTMLVALTCRARDMQFMRQPD